MLMPQQTAELERALSLRRVYTFSSAISNVLSYESAEDK